MASESNPANPKSKTFHLPDGIEISIPVRPASSAKGMFAGRVTEPVPVEEMEDAAEAGAVEEFEGRIVGDIENTTRALDWNLPE